MITGNELLSVMEEEGKLLDRLLEAILKERQGIVNHDASFLRASLAEMGEVKVLLDRLEEERAALAGGKRLRDIISEVDLEFQGKLTVLQQDLKVKAREARCLWRANALLYRQSLSLLSQIEKEICGLQGRHYNQAGEVAGDSLAGKLVSSSA